MHSIIYEYKKTKTTNNLGYGSINKVAANICIQDFELWSGESVVRTKTNAGAWSPIDARHNERQSECRSARHTASMSPAQNICK